MDDDLNKIIENLGKTFEAFKAAHAEELKALRADVVTSEKIERIQKALDEQVARKEAAEKAAEKREAEMEKKIARLMLGGGGGDPAKAEAEVKAFNAHVSAWDNIRVNAPAGGVTRDGLAAYKAALPVYFRRGAQALDPEQFKAMSVGGDPDGGYLVTPDTTGRIVQRVFDTSPIRQLASVQTIGTDALEGLRDIDEVGAGWVSETGTRAVSTTPQVGMWRISAHEMFSQPDATQKVIDDANVDIESWLAMKVADRFARLENTAFVAGNGVNQPRGFTTYTTAATADASRAWGQLEHVNTTANGAFASSDPGDVLFDLISRFKPQYLQNATWVMPRAVLVLIRKFKESTTNAYMWQPGLQRGAPQELLGYPVTMAEDMPALGTGSLSLALGDFRWGYQIVDRQGIRVLRDPYSAKPYVRFYTTKRTGGDVVQFEAIKFLRFST